MTREPVVIGVSRTGDPTASWGSLRIHSAFNPVKEAGRFVDSFAEGFKPGSTIIVLGAALGYVDRILSERCKSCQVIAVHLDEYLYKNRIYRNDRPEISRWHPEMGIDLETFLFTEIKETDLAGLRVLEWPVLIKIREKLAFEASRALAAVVRHHSGNISASAAFGRHWIRNTFRNFIETDRIVSPISENVPVVLAASGPSLEEGLEILRNSRKKFRLWALPSALPALTVAQLKPDLIFSTDPGHWARIHCRYFTEGVPVAMPLSAVPRPLQSGPPLLIPQGMPGETALLAGAEWKTLPLPAMGTVAATAVEAWRRMSSGPIILMGLDLAWNSLQAHARPHAFNPWLKVGTGRLRPELTMWWERASAMAPEKKGMLRTGPSMKTYADWFSNNLQEKTILRFRSSSSRIETTSLAGVEIVDESVFGRFPEMESSKPAYREEPAPLKEEGRREMVIRLIRSWKDSVMNPQEREGASGLMYALDPGGVVETRQPGGDGFLAAEERHINRILSILGKLERSYG